MIHFTEIDYTAQFLKSKNSSVNTNLFGLK